jgi:limonene-1,2-epoxide hydrolase
MTTAPTHLARRFIAAWEARDVEAILALMTPDARYLNVGMPEAVGREAIGAFITPFVAGASAIRWTVRHIAETADGAVLTERIDVFVIGGREVTVPVMGVFEFDGELIKAWRDYFDLADFQRQMAVDPA